MNALTARTEQLRLESVIVTGELRTRPARTPDFQTENLALAALAQAMTNAPDDILQLLAETTLTLCHAGSAGISIVESGTIFRWHGLAGALAGHRWSTTPRDHSPCGTVLDQNSMLLMSYPERHFHYFADIKPTIVEALLIPFEVDGKTIGTVWAVSHDEQSKFDAEDSRILANLAKFASACYHARASVEKVREADKRKDEFLATLAHELRNPLAPLLNALHISRVAGGDPITTGQMIPMMERQVNLMARLVDDLLDIARITQGKLEVRREPIDVAAIVDSALETASPFLKQGRHELGVSMPEGSSLYVNGDATRLSQVLCNLLSNAAKYSDAGTSIQLSVKQQGGDILISVKDEGMGIPANMLHTIFDMFSQVDRSLERSQSGLGIGLTLARQIVKLHEGTIEAKSAGVGHGSEFIVRLPGKASPHISGAPARETGNDVAAHTRRILIADDNRDSAECLGMLLRMKGHEVHIVHNGLEAVEVANTLCPDVILLDIGMPRLNGYDAARAIRQQDWADSTVLIAITGWGQEDDRRRSEEAGFDHHLIKPVEAGTLERLLRELKRRTAGQSRPA